MLPDLNVDLLRNLLLWAAKEHDKLDKKFAKQGILTAEWEQGSWAEQEKNGVCKTAYCMAGAATVATGHVLVWDRWFNDETGYAYTSTPTKGAHVERSAEYAYKRGQTHHEKRPVWDIAREEIGLTEWEADVFFDGGNTLYRLYLLARDFCEARYLEFGLSWADLKS